MSNLLFKIIDVLADGKFHSGEILANQFKVSRVSIWNAISEAEQFGIEIHSVRGKGYKLTHAVELLDESSIKRAIGEQANFFNIEVMDITTSTNSVMMQRASEGLPHASCIATNIQTAGKGRRGRKWVSELGENLTFSFLWRFNQGAAMLSGLSLVVGIALIRTFKQLGINHALLKWPNDVLIFHEKAYKKLAGILIELQGDMDGQSLAVIGIGINLNISKKQIKKIDQPAIDLQTITQESMNPNNLIALIIKELARVLSEFELNGFSSLKEEWVMSHAFHEKVISLTKGDGQNVIGKVIDISDEGSLILQTNQGQQNFSSGEVVLNKDWNN
ncbi:MAG: biotin--[acetyl-CoA-carboxylase] ligase [Methylophilaceae bacterium]